MRRKPANPRAFKPRIGPDKDGAVTIDQLTAIRRFENRKSVMYKLVDTYAGILKRRLWLKDGACACTDGHEIIVPLDHKDAIRLEEHELAHVMFRSDGVAKVLFIQEYTKRITEAAASAGIMVHPSHVMQFLEDLIGLLEDHRVDSLWGLIFRGSAKLKKALDQEMVPGHDPDPHASIMSIGSWIEADMPDIPAGPQDRYRPYWTEAIRKVTRRGFSATLVTCKWMVTALVSEILREQQNLPPPPPAPPQAVILIAPPSAPQSGDQPQGSGSPGQSTPGDDGQPSEQQPWEPPKVDATPEQRARALQQMIENHEAPNDQDMPRSQGFVPGKYPSQFEQNGAKNLVQQVLSADVTDACRLENGLCQTEQAMDQVIDQIRKSMRQRVTPDEWLRKGALAKVVFKDVSKRDVVDTPLPLTPDDQHTIRRLRAVFNRIMGRRKVALDDVGTELDVEAYLQARISGEPRPFFKREAKGQGFKAMLLIDRSGSMGGYKEEQAVRACRVISRALKYPFVDLTIWGFQSLGAGQCDIARFDPHLDAFDTPKSATGGTTPLNVATRVAIRHMEKGTDQKQLIIITDGFPVYSRRDGRSFGTFQLMLWTRDEIHKARHHGISTTGVVIGNDLLDEQLSLMFGPRRNWRRMRPDRFGSDLVALVSSAFVEYLKRG